MIKTSIQRAVTYIAVSTALLMGVFSLSVPVTANALANSGSLNVIASAATGDACNTLSQLNSSQSCGGGGSSTVHNLVRTILNILSFIVGAVAIVMIVLSGLKFITSGGDSQKVSQARTALLYAVIGLIVVALTQAIIHFALDTAGGAAPCPSSPAIATSDKDCH